MAAEIIPFSGRPNMVARQSPRNAQYRDLSLVYEGSSEEHSVRTPDLSTSGMFINTNRYFPEGAVLDLDFKLSRSGYQVKARGEVRYCLSGVGVGVEFVTISDEAKRVIEQERD